MIRTLLRVTLGYLIVKAAKQIRMLKYIIIICQNIIADN